MTTDRRLAVALAASVLVLLPAADTPVDTPVEGVVGADVRAAFPGLYLPDSIAVTGDAPSGFTIRTSQPCSTLESILGAGDWSIAEVLSVPPEVQSMLAIGGLAPMIRLTDGAGVVGALTSERTDGCRAELVGGVNGPVRLGRDVEPAEQPGWALTTRCFDADGELLVDTLVGTADASALVRLQIDAAAGTATLDESSDSMLVTGPTGLLDLMSEAFASSMDGAEPPVPEGSTVATAEFGGGRVELAGDGLSGDVVLDEFEWWDERSGESGISTVAFPFRCGTVTSLD